MFSLVLYLVIDFCSHCQTILELSYCPASGAATSSAAVAVAASLSATSSASCCCWFMGPVNSSTATTKAAGCNFLTFTIAGVIKVAAGGSKIVSSLGA